MKTWGKHPVFTSGAVFGETLQFYVGGKAIDKVFKIGGGITRASVRYTVPKTVNIAVKYPLIARGFGLTKNVLSDTRVGNIYKNVGLWAKEGYKPGKKIVEVATTRTVSQDIGLNIQRFKYVVDRKAGQIWISPAEQAAYASRIAKGGVINIGFPTSKQLGRTSEKIEMIGTGESFRSGLLGGLKQRSSITVLKDTVVDPFKNQATIFVKQSKPKFGTTIQDILKAEKKTPEIFMDVSKDKSMWYNTVKNMYKKGYPSTLIKTDVAEVEGIKITAFGRDTAKPFSSIKKLPSTYVNVKNPNDVGIFVFGKQNYPTRTSVFKQSLKDFASNTKAAGQITINKLETNLGGFSRRTLSPSSVYLNVPRVGFESKLGGLFLGVFNISGVQTSHLLYKSELNVPVQNQFNTTYRTPVYNQNVSPMVNEVSISGSQERTIQDIVLVKKQKQVYDTVFKTPTITTYKMRTEPVVPFVPVVKPRLRSPWGWGGGENFYVSKYKFRKFNIPDLSKLMRRVGM